MLTVVVGVLTNIATGDGPQAWPWLVAAGVGLASVQLALWFGDQRRSRTDGGAASARDRRRALARVRTQVDQQLMGVLADLPVRLDVGDRSIGEAFDEGESLVVLGAAGAGKTTSLLRLGSELLAKAEADPDEPVPVFVSLAAWRPARQRWSRLRSLLKRAEEPAPVESLARWLPRRVRDLYRIPEAVTSAWLSQRGIVLLLDGLDEVPAEHRRRCVRSINLMLDESPQPPIALTSRADGYPGGLRVDQTVSIAPLTRDQVERHIAADPAAQGLRAVLDRHEDLWDLVTTPLWLSVATVALRDAPDTTVEQTRRLLLDGYLAELLGRWRTRRDPVRTVRYLATLARIARSLGGAQVDLATAHRQRDARMPDEVIAGFHHLFHPYLLAGTFVTGMYPAVAAGGFFAVLVPLSALGVVAAILVSITTGRIPSTTLEAPRSLRGQLGGAAICLVLGALVGLLPYLVGRALAALGGAAEPWLFPAVATSVIGGFAALLAGDRRWVRWSLLVGTAGAVAAQVLALRELSPSWTAGFGAGAATGFLITALTPDSSSRAPDAARPLTGVPTQIALAWAVGLGALVFVPGGDDTWSTTLGVFCGLAIGVPMGFLLAVVQAGGFWRFVYRITALCTGLLPWRTRRFLREAASHGLLRGGATHTFPHLLFTEHLAAINPANGLPPLGATARAEAESRWAEAARRVRAIDGVRPAEDTATALAAIDAAADEVVLLTGFPSEVLSGLTAALLDRGTVLPLRAVLTVAELKADKEDPFAVWDPGLAQFTGQWRRRYGVDPLDAVRWLHDGRVVVAVEQREPNLDLIFNTLIGVIVANAPGTPVVLVSTTPKAPELPHLSVTRFDRSGGLVSSTRAAEEPQPQPEPDPEPPEVDVPTAVEPSRFDPDDPWITPRTARYLSYIARAQRDGDSPGRVPRDLWAQHRAVRAAIGRTALPLVIATLVVVGVVWQAVTLFGSAVGIATAVLALPAATMALLIGVAQFGYVIDLPQRPAWMRVVEVIAPVAVGALAGTGLAAANRWIIESTPGSAAAWILSAVAFAACVGALMRATAVGKLVNLLVGTGLAAAAWRPEVARELAVGAAVGLLTTLAAAVISDLVTSNAGYGRSRWSSIRRPGPVRRATLLLAAAMTGLAVCVLTVAPPGTHQITPWVLVGAVCGTFAVPALAIAIGIVLDPLNERIVIAEHRWFGLLPRRRRRFRRQAQDRDIMRGKLFATPEVRDHFAATDPADGPATASPDLPPPRTTPAPPDFHTPLWTKEGGVSSEDIPDLLAQHGSLAIVGPPNSGRTTVLHHLAATLTHPTPLLLSAATWTEPPGQRPLLTWLATQAAAEFNTTPETARHWLTTRAIALLLDDFDTLPHPTRFRLAGMINDLVHAYRLPVVIAATNTPPPDDVVFELGLRITISP
ncbi:energy-coupling factor transporter ATP-binding protein EcfA2 [Actinokineospora baliensis]|uniref:NACHT domain-containing protein n=1 Tax=Actinokineospora baliensis TaxID=547056 RepID=UPI001956EBE7|nr:NACHT domain-containing protein [Actinokineospora baliensis]MBM7774396.1 energy-coupling factor transporter ATP-binding protein EcfA2 [Actinokineospora baliensis]